MCNNAGVWSLPCFLMEKMKNNLDNGTIDGKKIQLEKDAFILSDYRYITKNQTIWW